MSPLYVKTEQGIVDKATFDRHVPAHIAYIRSLRAQGLRVESGYWSEESGGMMIFEAPSLEAARKLVEADPLVLNHCVTYRLRTWNLVGESTESRPDD